MEADAGGNTQTSELTSTHWGVAQVFTDGQKITAIKPHPNDLDPSPISDNLVSSLNGRARILRPAIREGWLNGGTGERGKDRFVEVSWDEALDRIAGELRRIRTDFGNEAIYAGSYGWASAGRFHHAQSQLKRFLNTQGGFTGSEGNYSYNAALCAMPLIVGGKFRDNLAEATRWPVIAEHSDLVVLFGGLALRNTQICDGGASQHRMRRNLDLCKENGVRFINISPLSSDVANDLNAEWMPPKPGTDTAVMMGLAHTLLVEVLHDQAFLEKYTVGFGRFRAYLTGETDGIAKDADWAAELSGIEAERLKQLARDMAQGRTMIACAAGLQRADWGEQVLWMTVTLAAMLGQIGLPGGGYTVGYAVNGHVGNIVRPFPWGAFPQGENPVKSSIPVAMVSDMLLNPGGTYRYMGDDHKFPDTRMVWWAGGNPFHHHQDLNRLRQAFQKPETIIVNEINWTATARHADIVLPIAASTERLDFGAGKSDNILVPMPKIVDPPGEARVEFDIYADLAERLGSREAFTEGLTIEEWLRRIWDETLEHAKSYGSSLPDWDAFIAGDIVELPDPTPDRVFLQEFRDDPVRNPRPTASGKIELFSETIAGFSLPECPGHATWNPPRDAEAGKQSRFPLFLLSGQPATRLHSQLDNGDHSKSAKIQGREPILVNPADAIARGIVDGDVVEVFNDRGRCLAGARVTDEIVAGTVFLWTGAWFDPDFDAPNDRDRHGNPNVLTHDLKTSEFTQSPAAHSALVEISPLNGEPPEIMAHQPPDFADV
ncbi:MAG: molybdopterin-dependent oxidoreductase [Pseudomonadota bacterium]